MKPLTETLKTALAALARDHAGEMLSSGHKARLLSGMAAQPLPAASAQRREVVLSVGSLLPPRVMRYAIGLCRQNDAELYVLCRDAESAGQMLAPSRDERIAAGVECRVEEVSGSNAVVRFFQRHTRALCVIVTGNDPVSDVFGSRRKPPVPLVQVEDAAPLPIAQRAALAD